MPALKATEAAAEVAVNSSLFCKPHLFQRANQTANRKLQSACPRHRRRPLFLFTEREGEKKKKKARKLRETRVLYKKLSRNLARKSAFRNFQNITKNGKNGGNEREAKLDKSNKTIINIRKYYKNEEKEREAKLKKSKKTIRRKKISERMDRCLISNDVIAGVRIPCSAVQWNVIQFNL